VTLSEVLKRPEPVIVYTGAGLAKFRALMATMGKTLPANAVEVRGIRNQRGGRDWVFLTAVK
jgi:hypothetical protein